MPQGDPSLEQMNQPGRSRGGRGRRRRLGRRSPVLGLERLDPGAQVAADGDQLLTGLIEFVLVDPIMANRLQFGTY